MKLLPMEKERSSYLGYLEKNEMHLRWIGMYLFMLVLLQNLYEFDEQISRHVVNDSLGSWEN